MKGSSYLSRSLWENCLSYRRNTKLHLYFIIISDVQLRKIIATREMIVSVYLKRTLPYLEKLSGIYLLYIIEFRWMKADNWRLLLLSRVIVYARETVEYEPTKRMCERKPRVYFPSVWERECRLVSYPPPWMKIPATCTHKSEKKFAQRDKRLFISRAAVEQIRFNLTFAYLRFFTRTERVRTLQKTIVAFCFHASDTESKVTWVFLYTQIMTSLLAYFDDKVIA